jgi:DNA-binding NtrC family response regulator
LQAKHLGVLVGDDFEDDAVELESDEFYDWQLEGCAIETVDGTEIGKVRELMRTGAGEILVVDGDDGVRRAAHALLGRFGCEVETAHDGDEALLMARSFHYDAVLVDIRLPDMNGYECFAKLREIHEHLEVILMTGFGYDPEHSIVKSRELGLRSVLYKPFRLDQLLNEVEKCVTSPADRAKEK